MKQLILSLVLLLPFCSLAGQNETNLVYPTDDGRLFLGLPLIGSWDSLAAKARTNVWQMKPQRVEEARKMPECRPAKDFPEGNWGSTNAGLQLSLRFTKQTYTDGEPITAILLVRNVTNELVSFVLLQNGMLGGPIPFEVMAGDGHLIPAREYSTWIMVNPSSWMPTIPPQTQRKLEEHLDGAYNLTNGTYSIRAVLSVGQEEGNAEVKSAAVPLRIEPSAHASHPGE